MNVSILLIISFGMAIAAEIVVKFILKSRLDTIDGLHGTATQADEGDRIIGI